MQGWAKALMAGLACGAAACTSLPPPGPAPDLVELAERPLEDRCAGAFQLADHHIATAGVRDAEAVRVPGHRYLRADRFLASFRDVPLDEAGHRDWVGEMRRLDREGRAVETANLPQAQRSALTDGLRRLELDGSPEAVFERCGTLLAEATLADPAAVAALRARVDVPDNYSTARRIFGLYPLTAVGAVTGYDVWKRENLAVFDMDPEGIPVSGEITAYGPDDAAPDAAEGRRLVSGAPRNGLGMPIFSAEERAQLFALHAPVFQIDVTGDFDRPGRPYLAGNNGRLFPAVATEAAEVYGRLAYTRFQGKVLVQLAYTVWFAERPADGVFDILSGRLDGLTWRVTLAADGTPLVYDSIHPCGCYHMFFPVPPTVRRPMPEDDDAREAALVPAEAPQLDPGDRIVVRLASRSHYIQAVGKTAANAPVEGRYRLVLPVEPDGPLRMLALPDGSGTRSLYDETGLVPGTERAERWLLWPMGIDSAGAMRQWGTHATAFVGRRHFDDQDLLDRAFSR